MNCAAEALRQVIEGTDFASAKSALSGLSAESAATIPPGMSYSIATYVKHAILWHQIWLGRLKGEKRPSILDDWKAASVEEWSDLRTEFLEGLSEASRIASRKPFVHSMKTDAAAERVLLKIAIHDAYHVGQVVLLKRALRAAKRRQ